MTEKRLKVGILGTGNIGSDLLAKVMRSPYLEVGIFAGRDLESRGMRRASELGVPVTDESINYFIENPQCCDLVFDATTASAHHKHAEVFKRLNKFVLDLTPAHVGPFCIPALNADKCLDLQNLNLVTCGGQATVPIAAAISAVQKQVSYFEIVATISSKSAGAGTRNNIDEFTQTTSEALKEFTGIKNSKAIIILNPAEPPITMHNTLFALIEEPDMPVIRQSVREMAAEIRKYVPGYQLVTEPVYENGRVSTTISVQGSGDYLPQYAGNLDIITCAAVELAQRYAQKRHSHGS